LIRARPWRPHLRDTSTVAANQVSGHRRILMIHRNQVKTRHLTAGHHELVTDDSDRATSLSGARSYLRDVDAVQARLIDDRPDFDPRAWISQLPPMDLFGALLFQVTGQQLSVAATRRTMARHVRRACPRTRRTAGRGA
jgi:hypothetical protein